jgi:hypothetical protein
LTGIGEGERRTELGENSERSVLQEERVKQFCYMITDASRLAILSTRVGTQEEIDSPWASSTPGHHILDWACWADCSFLVFPCLNLGM